MQRSRHLHRTETTGGESTRTTPANTSAISSTRVCDRDSLSSPLALIRTDLGHSRPPEGDAQPSNDTARGACTSIRLLGPSPQGYLPGFNVQLTGLDLHTLKDTGADATTAMTRTGNSSRNSGLPMPAGSGGLILNFYIRI